MISALCVIAIAVASEPQALTPQIASAVIYPSGFALVTREAWIESGDREYVIAEIPNALDGTFWITSADAVVDAAVTTLRYEPRKFTRGVANAYEFINANVGKKTTVQFVENGRIHTASGTLMGFLAMPTQPLILKDDSGRFRLVSSQSIRTIDTSGFESQFEVEVEAPVQEIRLKTRSAIPSVVRILSLEPGAIWVQSYLVDLHSSATADVSSKLQIGLAGLKLKDTHTKLVSGLPLMGNTTRYDLASGIGSIQAYMRNSQSQFRRYGEDEDPYDKYQRVVSTLERMLAQQPQQFAGGAGGFGGGFGGGGFGGDGQIYDRAPAEQPTTTPERVEELFTFDIGRINLEQGERLTRSLFSGQSEHTTFFRVTIAPDRSSQTITAGTRPLTVNRILRLQNKSDHPWTRGLCMLMRDGIIFARTAMPFTAPGKAADLSLGSPDDISATWMVRESRRDTVRVEEYRSDRTRVTLTFDIVLVNNRNEPADFELVGEFFGEVLEPGNAQVVRSGFDANALNPRSLMTWRVTVGPESTLTLQSVIRTIL